MNLVDLLGSLLVSGIAAAGLVSDAEPPVATRPLAATIEVRGADVAWISPGPVRVVAGVDLTIGWVAHAGPDGLIRFEVAPGIDYTVTARRGDLVAGFQNWTIALPVTRDHRIEQAVRDRIDADARFQAERANFFDFTRWMAVINAELQPLEP